MTVADANGSPADTEEAHGSTRTSEEVARRFHDALQREDWQALRLALTDDAHWLLPGRNAVSGPAEGAEAVVARARLIAAYRMRFDLQYVLYSSANMALQQHNTAERDGRRFDEHVATVCTLRDGQISRIERFVSDPASFDRYFV